MRCSIPLFLLFFLFIGCVEQPAETSTSTTATALNSSTTSTSLPAGGFRLHEWGVLAGCPESESFFLTSRPKQLYLVEQPVIYVHADDNLSFDLTVVFNAGKPTDTYPVVPVEESGVVEWNNVRIVDDCSKVREVKDVGFIPLEDILDTLADVDSACLEVNGVRERFLFYEGEIEYVNKISAIYDLSTGTATLTNNGEYPVYNLMLIVSSVGEAPFSPQVHSALIDELKAGEQAQLILSDKTIDSSVLEGDMMSLGFTQKEADSFASLWADSFFRPTNQPGYVNLIYRISEQEYDRLISLKVSPRPRQMIRSLYVLVDLSDQSDG
ncbi:MAG: hypothetical protein B6U97_01825 [Candidatus Altiarchaeales archaeon ex4484_96]|nr:MAG: hypothetical protein B6U97_01825 [Candidatus Altiarchaeales archaeon ex4484_96]